MSTVGCSLNLSYEQYRFVHMYPVDTKCNKEFRVQRAILCRTSNFEEAFQKWMSAKDKVAFVFMVKSLTKKAKKAPQTLSCQSLATCRAAPTLTAPLTCLSIEEHFSMPLTTYILLDWC